MPDLTWQEALAVLQEKERRRKLFRLYSRLYDHSKPFGADNVGVYGWQAEFHNAGLDYTERALVAANRVGKSATAAAEIAIHLVGWYPDWWQGRRWDRPTSFWTGCETAELSRDVVQAALLGPDGEHGTGMIPGECIVKKTYRQAGVNDVVDTIRVRHVSGGVSDVTLKTYRAGAGGEIARKAWQGTAKDGVWFDEEPPMEIYMEGLTRVLDKKGIVMATFTPLLGQTGVVNHFVGKHEIAA